MLTSNQIQSYLSKRECYLIDQDNHVAVTLTDEWAKKTPDEAGVYAAFEEDDLVYVGETVNIQKRMKNLQNSRQHALRRNIVKLNFSDSKGYPEADGNKLFPQEIEKKVDNWLENKIRIAFLPTTLGRAELEEKIIQKYRPKYNIKGKGKSN